MQYAILKNCTENYIYYKTFTLKFSFTQTSANNEKSVKKKIFCTPVAEQQNKAQNSIKLSDQTLILVVLFLHHIGIWLHKSRLNSQIMLLKYDYSKNFKEPSNQSPKYFIKL